MQLNRFWLILIHRNFDLTIIDQRTNGETEAMSRRVGERDGRVPYQRMSRLVQHIGLQNSITKTGKCSSATIMLVDWHSHTDAHGLIAGALRTCHAQPLQLLR
jgi:hypothetical protein